MSKSAFPPGSTLQALSDRAKALGNPLDVLADRISEGIVQLEQKIDVGASPAEIYALGRSLKHANDLLNDSLIMDFDGPLSPARVCLLRDTAQAMGVRQ